MTVVNDQALDLIFRKARTYYGWQDKAIPTSVLEEIYKLSALGPTSANCCPLRIIFVTSAQAKEKLRPCLPPMNVEKSMTAPVVALFAYDTAFYEKLPQLFPFANAKAWFEGNAALIEDTAFRNSSLEAAYFMLAARALGVDCGPMSGFDKDKLNTLFFPSGQYKINFICNLGYGDPASVPGERSPKLAFGDACQIQ